MKKIIMIAVIFLLLSSRDTSVYSETVNETDTNLCEAFKYVLIRSLSEPIDKAIVEIYKDDKEMPEDLTWAAYDTEILKVKQLFGVGGAYEITFKVYPYYRAHISYGEDIITVSETGKLIDYKHLKTYPRVDFE